MDSVVGLAIEALVALLLSATIVYCGMLDRRLRRFRADEGALRETISELVAATSAAERAIAALRATVSDSEETLADRLGRAAALSEQMAGQLGEGEEVIGRIAKIAKAARDHAERAASGAEIERVKAAHEQMRLDARRQAELETEARRAAEAAAAAKPVSASAAAAEAAERFANRIRALSLAGAAS
jgi:chromosome segregation ATPase